MRRDDDLCQFQAMIPDYGTRTREIIEMSLNRGFKSLMNEIERVGRNAVWESLEITIEPFYRDNTLVMRGRIFATGPRLTAEDIEKQIQISVQEPLRGND